MTESCAIKQGNCGGIKVICAIQTRKLVAYSCFPFYSYYVQKEAVQYREKLCSREEICVAHRNMCRTEETSAVRRQSLLLEGKETVQYCVHSKTSWYSEKL